MKWNNKFHQLDEEAKQVLENYQRHEKCYIFGAGIIGRELLEVLKHFGCFEAFIDNSQEKIQVGYLGEAVISLQQYIDRGNKGTIIIAASESNQNVIKRQLELVGKQDKQDFYIYDEFLNYYFPIICAYLYKKVFMNIAQVSVTERCTLKCKKCAHACHLVNMSSEDMKVNDVKETIDVFFSKVDYIKEFVLIGGEPLLYQQLEDIVSYVGECYRKKINIFCIVTNGTIIPNNSMLAVCKKYNVWFRISNYSRQVPQIIKLHEKLEKALSQYDVMYIIERPEHLWRDYGFEYVDNGNNEQTLIKVFDHCKTVCREMRYNRFYYCVSARAVAENMGKNVGESDYLDFNQLDKEFYIKQILEYNLGFSEKGYLDMCRFCHGSQAYKYPILAAEQVKR